MKKLILALLLLITIPSLAVAQISRDAGVSGAFTVSASSYSWSHTIGAGSNRTIAIGGWGEVDLDCLTADFDGSSATLIRKGGATGERYTYMWYVTAPTVGAHNVTLTSSCGAIPIGGMSISYFGVDQTLPIDDSSIEAYNGSGVTSRVMSVTTVTDNSWLVMFSKALVSINLNVGNAGGGPMNGGNGGQMVLQDGGGGFSMGDYNTGVTPAGSASMTAYYPSPTTQFTNIIAAFCPATTGCTGGGGATTRCYGMLLGVGCNARLDARNLLFEWLVRRPMARVRAH